MKLYEPFIAALGLSAIFTVVAIGVNEAYSAIKGEQPVALSDCLNVAVEIVKTETGHVEQRRCMDGEA